ncbi:MAG: hypothetical protein AUK48_08795 [Oscillatoriales cyanobacterium CG2_30_44_21]|nr:MAG: hypothetical protein AUK48_08795 [Oscillatoriales cyanobacterium CG2_30_44_21]
MRSDLEQLLLSEEELIELTGYERLKVLPSNQLTSKQIAWQRAIAIAIVIIAFVTFASIFLPSLRVAGSIFLISLTLSAVSIALEIAEVAMLFLLAALASFIYSIYVLIGATLGIILLCVGLAIASGGIAFILIKIFTTQWRNYRNPEAKSGISPTILRLFKEVDKCNKVIRDINIFDQLQDAGNAIKLESRESAIAAIRITRNDIVRALKTERILRENPDFHPDRFNIDLNAFEAIQMNDRAQEYGRIFDTTMQIAIDVQKAMAELHQFSTGR